MPKKYKRFKGVKFGNNNISYWSKTYGYYYKKVGSKTTRIDEDEFIQEFMKVQITNRQHSSIGI